MSKWQLLWVTPVARDETHKQQGFWVHHGQPDEDHILKLDNLLTG